MRLLARLLAVVALLAVPLGLAVASSALADRPGPPSVPAEPVLIEDAGPPPPSTPATSPDRTTARQPPAPGPQVVDPAPIPVDGDDDADDGPDEDGDDGD